MGLYLELQRIGAQLDGADVLNMCEAAGLIVTVRDDAGHVRHWSQSLLHKLELTSLTDPRAWASQLTMYNEQGDQFDVEDGPWSRTRRTGIEQPSTIILLRTHRGRELWLQMSYSPLELGAEGWSTLGIGTDVTAMKQAEGKFRHLAATDRLTGLLNRRGLLERILQLPARGSSPLEACVVMLDLDRFKRVNDRHRHAAGDEALRHVATILDRSARDNDIVARWGGEEFIAVLPDADIRIAARVAERMRASVAREPLRLDDERELRLTISAGVARGMCGSVEEFTAIAAASDRALYVAKESGRDRVVCDGAAESGGAVAA